MVGSLEIALSVATVAGTCARATRNWRGGLLRDLDDLNLIILSGGVRDTHIVQAVVVVDVLIVEPRAVASLPGSGADHAELGCTAAL